MRAGDAAVKGYFNYCPNCIKNKSSPTSERGAAIAILLILLGVPMLALGPAGGIGFFFIFFVALLALSSKEPHAGWPTVLQIREKLDELNRRADQIRATITSQELEELYEHLRKGGGTDTSLRDPRTMLPLSQPAEVDLLIKQYVQSGLSWKEAILKMAGEQRVMIKPGWILSPTIEDALSEAKSELRKAKLDELARIKEAQAHELEPRLYEDLFSTYRKIYGSGAKRVLDRRIESYIKKGLERNEAVVALAGKEGLLPKER